jgi:hypothetical protein
MTCDGPSTAGGSGASTFRTGRTRVSATPARYTLSGGEAVLLLRAVIANGDFEEYRRFHVQREYQRVHASRYQEQFTSAA